MSPRPLSSTIHLRTQPQPQQRSTKLKSSPAYIIYFITGNPGLIEYYRIFLTHLYGLLTSPSTDTTTFHIYGRSLSGFETGPSLSSQNSSGPSFGLRRLPLNPPPYGLQEQIQHSEEDLEALVRDVKKLNGGEDVRVIVMGHSVGAYMLLEITRRLREKEQREREGVRIVGGICLFPTVVDIAKSDSGRKSSWFLPHPRFAHIASLAAKALAFPLPVSVLTLFIRGVLRFPADAALVTASFIKSPHGVQQALHMARDEMLQIKSNTWDTEIWGAAHASFHSHARPVLRFLFAKEDHWVADETRDDLIRTLGTLKGGKSAEDKYEDDNAVELDDVVEVEDWKPVMEIDEEEGWPHGFCIKHSVPVAERVFGYVREIVNKDYNAKM